jgi:L-asparaginase type I
MAQTIAKNYDNYEGFVILHGTDTMVYTASALSFMLRELDKPVIVTGAQRSAMVDVRNDATQNFITSLLIANPAYSGLPLVPEVCIFFGGKLLRGNRCVKVDTSEYIAYETPNFPLLGTAGNNIVIDEKRIRTRPDRNRRFHVRTQLEPNVTPIYIFPGVQDTDLVARQLESPQLKGAIVLAYGSGDIPTRPDFVDIFRKARERGLVVGTVTQCLRGPIQLGIYETSAMLLEAGFVSAFDITLESALCKLMSLLGDPDISQEEVELAFQQSMAGEQSVSVFVTPFPGAANKSLEGPKSKGETAEFRVPGRPLEGVWSPAQIDNALLRLRGAKVSLPGNAKAAQFKVFINLNPGEEPGEDSPSFAGTFRKYASEESPILVFDVTRALIPVARPSERVSLTLFLDTPGATVSWESAELALFVRETEG